MKKRNFLIAVAIFTIICTLLASCQSTTVITVFKPPETVTSVQVVTLPPTTVTTTLPPVTTTTTLPANTTASTLPTVTTTLPANTVTLPPLTVTKPPTTVTIIVTKTVTLIGVKQTGSLRVELVTISNPPVSGNNTFEAFVTNAAGQPVSDAKISLDSDMTNMSMGRNVIGLPLSGEGVYSGKVYFSMPGSWRIIVTIDYAGQTSTVRFDFMVN
jgi:hypothetical protein